MGKERQVNLTEGPILRALTGLALPIMASSFLGTVYSITDMAWIGLLGAKAVAGVGVGGMYAWLSQGLVSLAKMGGQVHVAQCFGRGEREKAGNYAVAAIQMTAVFALIFSAVCLLFPDQLIGLFRLDDAKTYQAAKQYLLITCGLILFSYLNQTMTGLFTAQGDSRTPFAANLVGLATNMVLDPVLILGIGPFPRMEVAGAAVATVIAQVAAFSGMLAGVVRRRGGGYVWDRFSLLSLPQGSYYREIARIGIPTALQGTVYCMISMVLTRMVAVFGPAAVATQKMGGQIESVSWNTAEGFGTALNAFTGQNCGAGKTERVRRGYRYSFWMVSAWGTLILLAFLLIPEQISGIFFHEAEAVQVSVGYLTVISVCEPFMCVELMTIGALSGLGKTKLCSAISIFLTGMRIPLALLLEHTSLGLHGIWWALSLTSIAKGIVFYAAFARQMGKSQPLPETR